ncbi:uncharacterized protein si:ch211-136m16.8 isoform X2 [Corythoichthys intestinalis]|uniref:uncharacterized protein si:ch211-136m16.8 isoform X2 n=1 Tax=Corythoichthys intestinalis TaxID=161448 RepID=UPI0025A4FE2D|nr:uncharacterized protein si:ch211-136m16.8 isoform X2 [Corythoichthys intestinalis]
MEPTRVEGTLWNILYYITGAVNRFLRPEPSNIFGDDPQQDSTIGSGSSGDGPTTAGICKDHSDTAACHRNVSVPDWAGEETLKTESKAQLPDSERKFATMFFNVSKLSLTEKTVGDLEISSRPKTEEKEENADGLKFEVGPQSEGFEEEHQEHGVHEQSVVTTAEPEQGKKVELFNMDNDICKAEVLSAVPVEPHIETAQEIEGTFENMPLSVCDVSQQLHILTCEEPLIEQNSEAFQNETETQTFMNVPFDQRHKTEDIQEGVEKTVKFSCEKPFEQEWKMGTLTGSSIAKEESENINDTEEQAEGIVNGETDGAVEEVNEVFKDSATIADPVINTEEIMLCSISQNQDAIPEDTLNLGIQPASSEETVESKEDKISRRNQSLQKREQQARSETESFIEISSPELGFSEQAFWDQKGATRANSSSDVLQASVQNVLELSAWEILKTDSELPTSDSEESQEELLTLSGETVKTKSSLSLGEADKPKCEGDTQVSSFALNFAPQRARIAVKNPHARPPKDRRSLLLRPSVEPESAPPASKMAAGVHIMGNLGSGIKVPGLPVLRKLPKTEAELQLVPEADATKQAEMPQKLKWIPPRQTGFGNPFMSELKTKLKKATSN